MSTTTSLTGYVLHKRPYRSHSIMLTVLTESHGIIIINARGIKQPKYGVSHNPEPFQKLCLHTCIREPISQLRQFESEHSHQLTQHALYYGLYANELTIRTVKENDPQPDIYQAYQYLLDQLSQSPSQQLLLHYENQLMCHIGYDISACLQQHSNHFRFSENDLIPCQPNHHQAISRQLIIDMMPSTAANQITPAHINPAQKLWQTIRAHVLQIRPLHSRLLLPQTQS